MDISSIVASVARIYSTLVQNHRSSAVDNAVSRLYRRLHDFILTEPGVNDFEAQLCYSCVALCILLCSQYGTRADARCLATQTESPGEFLDAVAEAFIYKRYAGATLSSVHQVCIESMALGFGCACFLPLDGASNDLRLKGHIILFSLRDSLVPKQSLTDAGFAELLQRYQDPWNLTAMTDYARQAYSSATKRQREWEERGLFNLGVPRNDKVEYLVLRSFRGEWVPFNTNSMDVEAGGAYLMWSQVTRAYGSIYCC